MKDGVFEKDKNPTTLLGLFSLMSLSKEDHLLCLIVSQLTFFK